MLDRLKKWRTSVPGRRHWLARAWPAASFDPDLKALIAAAIIVPLILLVTVATGVWRSVDEDARRRIDRMTAALAEHAGRVVEVQEAILEAALARVRKLPPAEISTDAQVHFFLAQLAGISPTLQAIVLVELDTGRLVATSRLFPTPTDVDLSGRDYIPLHRNEAGRTHIGEVVVAPGGAVGFTVSRSDPLSGFIAVSLISLKQFEEFYSGLRDGERDVLALIRADASLLVRSPPLQDPAGARLPANSIFHRVLRERSSRPLVGTSPIDGVTRLYSQRPVPNLPIFAAYGLEYGRVRAAWLQQVVPLAFFILLGGILLIVLAMRAQAAMAARRAAELDAEVSRARAEQSEALRRSEEYLRLAQTVGGVGSWEWNGRTGAMTWSESVFDLLGLDPGLDAPSSDLFLSLIHPDDRAMVDRLVREGVADHKPIEAEFRIILPDGSVRWLVSKGEVIRGHDGEAERLIGILRDITQRKTAEEQSHLLMREVNHRSKNLLAVVQSIARQTARNAPSAPTFADEFGARLQSLSAAHDLVVSGDWQGVLIADLVRSQLSHLGEETLARRVRLRGRSITVTPAASQGIGLALHELATNAMKYGALSDAHGRIEISWGMAAGPDGESQFTMEWRERDGPKVSPPTRQGFGRTVIERMAAHAVGGAVAVRFEPDGVVWRLEAPATAVVHHPTAPPHGTAGSSRRAPRADADPTSA